MLVTRSLQFSYANGPSFAFPDVVCEKSGHLLVLGESGRGKTTLLHLMCGLLTATSGEVSITGTNIGTLRGAALDRFRGKHVGIVFQSAHFVESLSVLDNLILPQYLSGSRIDRTYAREVLSRLNLTHKAGVRPGQLSVGEAQRVAIARSVMNRPALILADEPTSALDDVNAGEVIKLLEEQARLSGSSLVIVTHDQRLKNHFAQQVTL
ncbi:MAG: ATP-binding cassette domain-containing protein [Flavobacteriales bacterium]|nr:ATP-binding cassette domain-containing protein [Flavobacteriales bacterium]